MGGWVGGWVGGLNREERDGGWVGDRKIEEDEAVIMSYCELGGEWVGGGGGGRGGEVSGLVSGWVGGLPTWEGCLFSI